MSTRTEPYRKYVAHDEKSKFFIFFPEIVYGKPRKRGGFCFLQIVFKPAKKSQIRYGPTSGQKHAKCSDKYLNINFALFNPHHNNSPI